MASLFAKSRRTGRDALSLEKHLLDTEEAAQRVFRLDGRWGEAFCRFFRLSDDDRARFLLNLRVAALLHDIGKANDEFQAAISGRPDSRQSLRHEHISALVLHLPEVRGWLAANAAIDLEVVTAAVLSHHLKASEEDERWRWGQSRRARRVRLRFDHAQVTSTFRRIAHVANLPTLVVTWPDSWSERSPWSAALTEGMRSARALRRELQAPYTSERANRRGLLFAVKAGLIVADSVASALVREDYSLPDWIEEVVHREPATSIEVERDVIRPRLEQLERSRKQSIQLDRFQTEVAKRGERVLLLAACGAGKTLAAWNWAQQRLAERPAGRVVFLYPTRGTATEGFRDYVGWAPEADAALVHGTARYELQEMATNPPESVEDKLLVDEAADRLYALGLWSKRYYSATVDQFLAFMEHRYDSLCLLPALADSVVIFDEVHSYDKRLFKTLIDFLRSFDVPALCMTATLPRSRQQELLDSGLQMFPSSEDRVELVALEEKEHHCRYQIEHADDCEAIVPRVREALARGRRVLMVVNVVARAQAWAARLKRELSTDVLCYHSRFRLCDRKRAHQDTVAAFQQVSRSALAVTTQVCEMSLDIDADLLITELAPTSALIQRFGRTNRHLARGPDFRAEIVVIPAPSQRPYEDKQLEKAREFIAAVAGPAVSQRQLAEALQAFSVDEAKLVRSARFLESGYYATPGSVREESDQFAASVLDTDLVQIKALRAGGQAIDGLVLAAPRRFLLRAEERPRWLPHYLGIVSAAQYDAWLGFQGTEV